MNKQPHRYFAGANTHKGFVDFFESAFAKFTYILKGTPGCGKNTLLKQVAKHFSEQDERVEYFYCSLDPDSLDGIRLTDKNVSILDGTAPHTIDSKQDGNDKIINLTDGVYISEKFQQKIAKLEKTKKKFFAKAQRAHQKAIEAHKKIEGLYHPYINFNEVTQITQSLIKEIEELTFT